MKIKIRTNADGSLRFKQPNGKEEDLLPCGSDDSYDYYSLPGLKRKLGIPVAYLAWLYDPNAREQEIDSGELKYGETK